MLDNQKNVCRLVVLLFLAAGCVKTLDEDKVRVGDSITSFEVWSATDCFRSPDDIKRWKAAVVFIDPECDDCHRYVSVLNECEGIIVISRSEDGDKVRKFIEETGIKHDVFYKGGYDAYYSMFRSIVPRVLFVRDSRIEKIFAEPSVPGADEIRQYVQYQ